jgi:hypothetical protein
MRLFYASSRFWRNGFHRPAILYPVTNVPLLTTALVQYVVSHIDDHLEVLIVQQDINRKRFRQQTRYELMVPRHLHHVCLYTRRLNFATDSFNYVHVTVHLTNSMSKSYRITYESLACLSFFLRYFRVDKKPDLSMKDPSTIDDIRQLCQQFISASCSLLNSSLPPPLYVCDANFAPISDAGLFHYAHQDAFRMIISLASHLPTKLSTLQLRYDDTFLPFVCLSLKPHSFLTSMMVRSPTTRHELCFTATFSMPCHSGILRQRKSRPRDASSSIADPITLRNLPNEIHDQIKDHFLSDMITSPCDIIAFDRQHRSPDAPLSCFYPLQFGIKSHTEKQTTFTITGVISVMKLSTRQSVYITSDEYYDVHSTTMHLINPAHLGSTSSEYSDLPPITEHPFRYYSSPKESEFLQIRNQILRCNTIPSCSHDPTKDRAPHQKTYYE